MSEGKKADLGALRQRLALVARGGRGSPPALPFGVPAIDSALPGGGLARGALHEVFGLGAAEEEAAEGAGFLAGILARLEPKRPVLWCLRQADLHAPGLALCGLAPERLILARARNEVELLWAMEEGLKCRALAAVVGELETLPLTASRRLQLAAESAGITAFALRRRHRGALFGAEAQPSAAVTRWRIAACPSRLGDEPGLGRSLWLMELLRCRGGVPARWMVEACDEAGHVHLAAALADRAETATPRIAAAG
ncbi:MAG TPA: damage-inducible protein [Stellaceae bacterium]|nr:damage-inducible protein [Stellaceae bacterium]